MLLGGESLSSQKNGTMKVSRYRIETIDFFEFQFVLAPPTLTERECPRTLRPRLEQSRECE